MEKFTYTAQRAQYLSFVIVITFVATIEAIILFVLGALLLPDGWRTLVEILVTAFHLLLLAYFYGPLFTAHFVTADKLKLHYSFGFRVTLPRSALLAAVPVQENLVKALPINALYNPQKQEVRADFSNKGQVRLYLSAPVRLRVGLFRVRTVRQLLINLDNRDHFLTVLKLPASKETSDLTVPVTSRFA